MEEMTPVQRSACIHSAFAVKEFEKACQREGLKFPGVKRVVELLRRFAEADLREKTSIIGELVDECDAKTPEQRGFVAGWFLMLYCVFEKNNMVYEVEEVKKRVMKWLNA